MSEYPVRYTEAPYMHISYSCGGLSCGSNTVEHDGDSFICSDCGTSWQCEDDGQLYEEWSGDEREGPIVDPHDWDAHQKATRTPEEALNADQS